MKHVVTLRNGAVAVLIPCSCLLLEQGWAYAGGQVATATGQLIDPFSSSLWRFDGRYRADGAMHPLDVVSGLIGSAKSAAYGARRVAS